MKISDIIRRSQFQGRILKSEAGQLLNNSLSLRDRHQRGLSIPNDIIEDIYSLCSAINYVSTKNLNSRRPTKLPQKSTIFVQKSSPCYRKSTRQFLTKT
jgi:hypothetical protein